MQYTPMLVHLKIDLFSSSILKLCHILGLVAMLVHSLGSLCHLSLLSGRRPLLLFFPLSWDSLPRLITNAMEPLKSGIPDLVRSSEKPSPEFSGVTANEFETYLV